MLVEQLSCLRIYVKCLVCFLESIYRYEVTWGQYVEGLRVFARLISPDNYELFLEALYCKYITLLVQFDHQL